MVDYCWSIKKDLNDIEHDKQSREKFFFFPNSNIHKGFINAVSLFNDLIKILGLGIFSIVIFRYVGPDSNYKNSISQ